jgi:D-alanyl-D-alanine carboxypeptidase
LVANACTSPLFHTTAEATEEAIPNALLREQVYGPLDLKKTTLPAGPNLRAPYIHGYDNDPNERPPDDISELVAAGWAWASGGMVSTPTDLNDFIRGYVGGDLFGPKTLERQRRVVEGGTLRSTRSREELCRVGHLPLRDEVRDGVGPHG